MAVKKKPKPVLVDMRAAGRKGGAARARSLTPERRAEIASTAGKARWAKRSQPAPIAAPA